MFLYCGRLIISVAHHFLLTICNLPPIFEWQILQIGIFAKFNSKKLLKMNIFVQNCLFLQHFPYY